MNKTDSCLNCALAEWHRNARGALHPDGGGKCLWQFPQIALPSSRYWIGYGRDSGGPNPAGGYISRREPYTGCPAWQPMDNSP